MCRTQPEWGSVARSPCRRAAEAAIHSPFQPEGEKLLERETARDETSGGLRVVAPTRLRKLLELNE